ncbi:MAG: PqqD family protein [Chloroflexota bacterium]
MTRNFRINTPGVVHEMIDGEVVIVNLDTGRYYSLDSVGAALWGQFEQYHSVEAITQWVQLQYEDATGTIQADVETFINQLLEDELLIVDDELGGWQTPDVIPAAGVQKPFAKPELNTYTDMEELLLLDPIHEVTDEGWPETA